jgi:hypothetical protein
LEVKLIVQYLPVKPKELQYAMQVSNLEIIYKMVVDSFENKNYTIMVEESGKNIKFRLNDAPMDQSGGAILKGTDRDECKLKFHSIMNRIRALVQLINSDDRAKPYLKSDPAGNTQIIMIDTILIETISTFQIYENVEIDKNLFFKRLESL